ncbi:MAG TPA: hypothetical protein DCE44_26140, partial [Verrucomicrobiales bacterium]|nr:hypothetical protein [Verrucomicrobiales bacterium]
MKRVRVNIRSVANAKAARHETRNGRAVVIVPSATLPDDVVMNDIRYPADEIEKSYLTLNRTPAPLGHPTMNGQFLSARDPEGINVGYVGAWNENARRENGRVFLDKVIDVEFANRSAGGKAVLAAIEAGEAIHTSTGLYCDLEELTNDAEAQHCARNITFDHDAILLGQEGAATPSQGVGIFVNAKGVSEEIEVINSAIDYAEDELDWAGTRLFDALDRLEKAGRWERVKAALMGLLNPERETTETGALNMADEKQLDALSAKVNAIEEAMKGIGDQIANAVSGAVKPLLDKVNADAATAKANEDAEKSGLEEKVVKANLLTAEAAKATPLNSLRELAKLAEPGKAAAINAAVGNGAGADVYDFNE